VDELNPDQALGLFLVDLALLIVLGRFLGTVLTRLGQPSVLGEIFAGILIGPSLLGAIAPGAVSTLFPPEAMALLSGIGNVGLVLFVFLIGLEIDKPTVRRNFGRVVKISLGSFLVPFAVGVLIAAPLQAANPRPSGDAVSQLAFALFIGTAFAVTALPVLARILTVQGLERSALGTMALAVSGILDLVGWMLLAAVLTVAAGEGVGDLLRTALEFLAFAIAVTKAVVPLLRLALRRLGNEGSIAKAAILVAAIVACAGATQLIGLHSVIGALLLGVALPRDDLDNLLGSARGELASVTGAVLLPVYFAIAGMGVNVSGFEMNNLFELAVLVGLACATKIAGTMLGARWAGLTWRDGLPLGVLMNTRGLIEVVVLNIGLAAGLLDETLYSELILMAVIATLMTGPIIQRLRTRSKGRLWREIGQRSGEPEAIPQHSF
jgi:Kef-type K+ transport system membrane component KefB